MATTTPLPSVPYGAIITVMTAFQPGPLFVTADLQYQEWHPVADAADVIDRLYLLELPRPVQAGFPAVADATSDLVIDLHAPARRAVTSTLVTPHLVPLQGPLHILGIRFQPGALRALQAFTPVERDGVMRPLTDCDVLSRRFRWFSGMPLHRQLEALQAQLIAAWRRTPRHPAVDHALSSLTRAPSTPSAIPELARDSGLSERQLRRRFLQYVGIAPVTYRRVRRTQLALQALAHSPAEDLAALAALHGYSDQAQMSREFRTLTGLNPSGWRDRIVQAIPRSTGIG